MISCNLYYYASDNNSNCNEWQSLISVENGDLLIIRTHLHLNLRKKEGYLKGKVDRTQCRIRLNNFDMPMCALLRRRYYGS